MSALSTCDSRISSICFLSETISRSFLLAVGTKRQWERERERKVSSPPAFIKAAKHLAKVEKYKQRQVERDKFTSKRHTKTKTDKDTWTERRKENKYQKEG